MTQNSMLSSVPLLLLWLYFHLLFICLWVMKRCGRWTNMLSACVTLCDADGWQLQVCHVWVSVSVSTAGPLHAVCSVVFLPWRTFYQTFVCKQISLKLPAFCNHIVYACLSVRVCLYVHRIVSAHVSVPVCMGVLSSHCEYRKYCMSDCDGINLPHL